MKYSMVVLLLLTFQASATINAEQPKYANHPIIGTWTYIKNGCAETYTFTQNGIRISTSRDEIVKAKYDVKTISKEKEIYLVRDEVLEDNGKADCSGSTEKMIGDIIVILLHIQDNPKRFSFCFDKELKECVGPFIKKK
jgi:hypothetical protein